MKYPNFNEEKKLWKKGFKFVVGLDEAGRGPLAGPVVAAAVAVLDYKKANIKNINDSKKLSEKQREETYNVLTNHSDIKWGTGIVSEKVIDKINILQATKLAMAKAIKNLGADFLLIDGNFKINSEIFQRSVIKGDQKIFSVAAASIIAKVTRDRIMKKFHKKYPQYGFLKHKGYGTKAHFANLEKFGPCKIHRKSFFPVNTYPQLDVCFRNSKELK
jgi:ribonuclease HII